MSKWIELTDRLPESEQDVLVTIREGAKYMGSHASSDTVVMAMFINNPLVDGKWYPHFLLWDNEGTSLADDVLAWMPLPEPWQEGARMRAEQTEPKEKCPFDDPIPCEWVKCPNSADCQWK